ncbi:MULTISPECIES: YbaB/EbfC family nucleoid-associated protein [Embleya]|uniref:Nucleoid-associated protein B4N89_15830 n=2 Tax=Embleya TaxID=2699295 RepID=A0A1T3NZD7_9ACTN|nr:MULTISPECIES: YbaB/EbfC family nucleoid-associated protein [Embleya]OPC82207.1 YbaB/EbfC family nucleoid-associated protein [Embleya scabrispora]
MFPGGGQPDMQQLLQQAQKMQQDLMAAQDELARTQVTGSAGGGLVTATVSGAGELLALEISPSAVDPEDTETLGDLIVAAVRDANRAALEMQSQLMGPLAQGMGAGGPLGLPGM